MLKLFQCGTFFSGGGDNQNHLKPYLCAILCAICLFLARTKIKFLKMPYFWSNRTKKLFKWSKAIKRLFFLINDYFELVLKQTAQYLNIFEKIYSSFSPNNESSKIRVWPSAKARSEICQNVVWYAPDIRIY